MTLENRLEDIARNEIVRGGFTGNLKFSQKELEPCFDACVIKLKDMAIRFNPKFDEEKPGRIDAVIRDLARHEINHIAYTGFKGCPRTVEKHAEMILEPIISVLIPKGYSKGDCHYISNALEDTILHADLGREFQLDGEVEFFADVGRHLEKGVFTEFYEAHVKLNSLIWFNKQDRKYIKQHYRHPEKVKEVLQQFLKRTGIAAMKKTADGIQVRDRRAVREYLTDEKNWPVLARIYAEEFSKLMTPGYACALPNHSGKGTKGNEGEPDEGNQSDEPDEGNQSDMPTEGNQFDKEMYSPGFKKQRIMKAHAKGENVPAWMESFEALDLLYQGLAQMLHIKVQSYTKQTSMPVFYYGKRQFDPDRDDLKHVVFGFNDNAKVELRKRRYHVDIPLEYKTNPKGFPEVRFCLLDTSGSMMQSPDRRSTGNHRIIPWGDNSKYHHALLSWYGLLEYLKQNHLLQQTGIALGNFSNDTYIGQGLAEAKRMALRPQFGDTYLDIDKIRKLFRDREMLVFTVSDGEIQNWGGIKEEFMRLAGRHHYFHLQIGYPDSTSRELEAAGFRVEYVMNAADLGKKVIDLTDRLYRAKK